MFAATSLLVAAKGIGTYHTHQAKKRSSLKIELSLRIGTVSIWINAIYPLLQCQSSSGSVGIRASDQNLEDPGSNPGWISMSFFTIIQLCKQTNKKTKQNKITILEYLLVKRQL